jgi:hypothetical protein
LEDAALLGGLPGRVIEGDGDRIPVEGAGKLVEFCAGVIVDVDEDVEVALEDGSKAANSAVATAKRLMLIPRSMRRASRVSAT